MRNNDVAVLCVLETISTFELDPTGIVSQHEQFADPVGSCGVC